MFAFCEGKARGLPEQLWRTHARPEGPAIDGPEDLYFSEYATLLGDEENWRRIGLAIDPKRLGRQIEATRVIRNKLMHFNPEGIDAEEMAHLRTHADFMSKIAQAQRGRK